ncbi:MAG: twin-arginine translocase subunit TatB [Bradyrhizobiaceae bacterium]|nr:twin-arginine translocase subunit TatB [Bradyrhizobiaceae bacterium]
MFDFSWGELLLIGVVALIVIGPKELPGVLRMIGQWVGKIRRMAAEFQSQFHEAMREAEMADLKKQVDDINDAARGLTRHFDPLSLDSTRPTGSTPPDVPAPSSTPPADATAAPSTDPQSAPSDSSAPEPTAPPVAEKRDAPAASQPSSPEPAPQEAEGGQRR